jgi:hypothetical protein
MGILKDTKASLKRIYGYGKEHVESIMMRLLTLRQMCEDARFESEGAL